MKFIVSLFKSILDLFAFKSKAREAWLKENGDIPKDHTLEYRFIPGPDGGRLVTSGNYKWVLRRL